jgi:SAM-dependent methyltransferase
MPSPAVLRTLMREIITAERAPRVPEPDLVMDDPAKVAAFNEAGRDDGVMAPVYLFHCAHACEVIRPGDRVVDLGCGPANQLAIIAGLNPEARFIGVDLSEPMLERARTHVGARQLSNVELRLGDVSTLPELGSASADAVISTMALHHLPGVEQLRSTFLEVRRILKHGGGVYLVDFGHLKSERSIDYFAHQYADRQPELFTLDYLYSLRAAFSLADFGVAGESLRPAARLYSTFLAPYMVAFKSARRREPDARLRQAIGSLRAALPAHHERDLRDLATFFGLGGMRSRLL